MAVSAENILKWLDKAPCILLIDELNNIVRPGMVNGELFAQFIKNNFLKNANQYFAFTSHVISTNNALTAYMVHIWILLVLVK